MSDGTGYFVSQPPTIFVKKKKKSAENGVGVGNSEGEINWHAGRVTVFSLPITGLVKHDKHTISPTFH